MYKCAFNGILGNISSLKTHSKKNEKKKTKFWQISEYKYVGHLLLNFIELTFVSAAKTILAVGDNASIWWWALVSLTGITATKWFLIWFCTFNQPT